MSLGDFSGNQWATCFQETAEALLGMSAQEVGDLFHDDKQFQEVFNKAAFKTCTLRLRAKMENYNVSMDGSCFAYTLRQWVYNLIRDVVTFHLVMYSKICIFWESSKQLWLWSMTTARYDFTNSASALVYKYQKDTSVAESFNSWNWNIFPNTGGNFLSNFECKMFY